MTQPPLEQIIQQIEQSEPKPVFVAVYGPQSNEKFQLINEIIDYFSKRKSIYKSPNLPDEGLLRDLKQGHGFDLYLFQCNGERKEYQDPNPIIEKALDRKINLNILVYDSQIHQRPAGEYDLIVCIGEKKPNPENTSKTNPKTL